MERDFREAIGDMPYHRRHDGLSAHNLQVKFMAFVIVIFMRFDMKIFKKKMKISHANLFAVKKTKKIT